VESRRAKTSLYSPLSTLHLVATLTSPSPGGEGSKSNAFPEAPPRVPSRVQPAHQTDDEAELRSIRSQAQAWERDQAAKIINGVPQIAGVPPSGGSQAPGAVEADRRWTG